MARLSHAAPEIAPSPLAFQAVDPAGPRTVGAARLWPYGRHRAALATAAGPRIMLFGESAAEGDGYTPWVSMSGVMERDLRATTGQPVEVLNFGMPGMGSRQILPAVRGALAAERPDVIVLYLGNNELHELRALKAASPHYDAKAELLRRRLWASHLYRVVATWLRPPAPAPAATTPLRDMDTPADADDRALAMALFAEHLDQMLAAAAGVPVVLATVAVNERDWRDTPNAPEEAAYRAGVALLDAGDVAGGRAKIREGESLATRPLRALPEARALVRARGDRPGVTLCDVDTILTDRAPRGLPGDDLFADACHPNLEGHRQIGALLSQCLLDATRRPGPLVSAPLLPDPTRLDRWTGRREPELPDDGTAQRAFERGHQRWLLHDTDGARAAWAEAVARGGNPAAATLNNALADLYAGDLDAARIGIAAATAAWPEDTQLAALLTTVTPTAGAQGQP